MSDVECVVVQMRLLGRCRRLLVFESQSPLHGERAVYERKVFEVKEIGRGGLVVAVMSMGSLAGAEDLGAADATVALVEQNAGDLMQPVADSTVITAEGTMSVEGDVEVLIPFDQDEPIAVSQETSSGVEVTVEIGLPDLGGLGESDLAGDSQSVFAGDDADIVVQPVEGGGVQALVTLQNAEAPTDIPSQVDVSSGGTLVPQPDGSVQVVAADGTLLGDFASPWAIDATGNPVATWFTISGGGELAQHVEVTEDTVFPVVVDPWWKPWTWNKRVYNCVLWGAAGAGVTAITGGTAGPIAASGLIGCGAGGLSR